MSFLREDITIVIWPFSLGFSGVFSGHALSLLSFVRPSHKNTRTLEPDFAFFVLICLDFGVSAVSVLEARRRPQSIPVQRYLQWAGPF